MLPDGAVARVVARAPGGLALARGRRVLAGDPAGEALTLVPAAGANRLGALRGRVHAVLTVRARDAAGPLGTVRVALRLGPARPWPATVGRSVRGRPLSALLPPGPAPLLVTAAIHGDERPTATAARAAVARVPVDRLRAVVVPVANPDGQAAGRRQNARGVDLNRNFPTRDWGGAGAYRQGRAPASEPETRALTGLVGALRPRAVVALHAPAAAVLGTRAQPLAVRLARATGLPLRASIGYPTPGSFATWVRAHGGAAVTVELPGGTPRTRTVTALATLLRSGGR